MNRLPTEQGSEERRYAATPERFTDARQEQIFLHPVRSTDGGTPPRPGIYSWDSEAPPRPEIYSWKSEAPPKHGRQSWTSAALFVLFLLAMTSAYADDPPKKEAPKPEIKSVFPRGVRAGRTTLLTLYGENLNPKEVSVSKTKTQVKLIGSKATDEKLKARGSREIDLSVTIPADAPPENIELNFIQTDGTKFTGSLCIVDDVEIEVEIKKPADTVAKAFALPGVSVAITGELIGDKADYVQFQAKQGETWNISVLAGRGGSDMDAILRIRDARKRPVALSIGPTRKDRRLAFKPTSDGTFYIELTEADAKGGPKFLYRLTVNKKKE